MIRRARLLTLIGCLIFSLPATLSLAQTRQDTPLSYAAPGPYAVGTRELVLEDAERPLHATLWYPARPGDVEARTVIYPLFGPGSALVDAPPDFSGAPYPLVVFSHGFSGTRHQSTFLTEHLASYGFVVIAADHPGTSYEAVAGVAEDDDPPFSALGAVATGAIRDFALRPADIFRQIDEMERLNAPGEALSGLVDVQRSAVAGHSFGGYTTVAASGARLDFGALRDWCGANMGGPDAPLVACLFMNAGAQVAQDRGLPTMPTGLFPATTDPRIRAALALAPWNGPVFGAEGLASVEIPIMVMVGSDDRTTPAHRDADVIYAGIGSSARYQVTLEGAEHHVFVGPCAGDLGGRCRDAVWEPERAFAVIDHFATAFFLATLTGDAAAESTLVPDEIGVPGVIYRADLR